MTVWKPDHGGPRPAHERSEANLWPRVSAHKPRIRTLTPLPPARAEVSGTSYFRALETADFEQAEGGHRSTKYMFKTVTESSGTAPVDVKGEASKTVFELTAERIDANEEGDDDSEPVRAAPMWIKYDAGNRKGVWREVWPYGELCAARGAQVGISEFFSCAKLGTKKRASLWHGRNPASRSARTRAHLRQRVSSAPAARAEVNGTAYFRALETVDFEQAEGGHRCTKYMFKTVTEGAETPPAPAAPVAPEAAPAEPALGEQGGTRERPPTPPSSASLHPAAMSGYSALGFRGLFPGWMERIPGGTQEK